jgi:hypothetical protein
MIDIKNWMSYGYHYHRIALYAFIYQPQPLFINTWIAIELQPSCPITHHSPSVATSTVA